MSGPMVKHHVSRNVVRINCKTENCVPIVVAGPPTASSSSSSSATPTSLPKGKFKVNAYSRERGNPVSDPAKNSKPIKMRSTKRNGRVSCLLPKCLNGCKNSGNISWMNASLSLMEPESLYSVSHSSSHEPSSEPLRRVVIDNHNIHTSFPEGPKLRDLPEDQNYKGSLQKT